jgi:hypothetical protein
LQTIPWHCKSTVSGDPEVELAYSLEEVFAWLRDCSEQIERAGIMQGLPRIHSQPREGASYEASLDILIPALMKLRERNHSLNTLVTVACVSAGSITEDIHPAYRGQDSREVLRSRFPGPHIGPRTGSQLAGPLRSSVVTCQVCETKGLCHPTHLREFMV